MTKQPPDRNQQLRHQATLWDHLGNCWILTALTLVITGAFLPYPGGGFMAVAGFMLAVAAVAAWCLAARCGRKRAALIDAEAAVFARELERL